MAEIERYYFRVEVELKLARAEVEHFRILSAAHYDGKCRSASAVGGFIYGWRNHFDWWERVGGGLEGPIETREKEVTPEDLAETTTVQVTWHQMDTLCKILEGEQFQSKKSLRMYGVIRKFLLDMRKESEKVNGQYAPKPETLLELEPGQKPCPDCPGIMSYTASLDPGYSCADCGVFEADDN